MKNLILIIFIILLSHCGYTSVYKGGDPKEMQISIVDMTGDMEFNNLVRTQLKKYSNKESKSKFIVKMESKYNKTVIAKNAAGDDLDYSLYLKMKFIVDIKENIKVFYFEEKFNVKDSSDTFNQRKYENIIRNNFAKSIKQKLVLKLSTLK